MKSSSSKDLHQRKETNRKALARRPVAEKLAIATRLREVEKSLAPVRAANAAKRAAKQIVIRIKTA